MDDVAHSHPAPVDQEGTIGIDAVRHALDYVTRQLDPHQPADGRGPEAPAIQYGVVGSREPVLHSLGHALQQLVPIDPQAGATRW
jgi:hypothetical protein